MRQKVFQRGCVGEVAATFAGDAELAPGLVHFLKQHNVLAALCRRRCRHKTGGTAADHDHVAI